MEVTRVFPVGNLIGVDYEVSVASSSTVSTVDVAEWFESETGLTGNLGNTNVVLQPGEGKDYMSFTVKFK